MNANAAKTPAEMTDVELATAIRAEQDGYFFKPWGGAGQKPERLIALESEAARRVVWE